MNNMNMQNPMMNMAMNNMNMQNPMMNMAMNDMNMPNPMMMNMMNNGMVNNMGNTQIPMMNNMNNMNPIMNNMQNQMMMNNLQTQAMNNMLMNNMMMNNLQSTAAQSMQNQFAMANQMNLFDTNMNNNQNFNNNTPNNDNNQTDFLSVFFRFSKDIKNPGSDSDGPTLTILCKNEDLVSTIIKKFRDKTDFKENAQFIFNAKRLNETLTVAESGIKPNSYIFVISVKYAGGIN